MGFEGLWKRLQALFPRAFDPDLMKHEKKLDVVLSEIMASLFTASPGTERVAERNMNRDVDESYIIEQQSADEVKNASQSKTQSISWEDSTAPDVYASPKDIAKHVFERPLKCLHGAGHIYFVGDDNRIRLKAKDWIRAKRAESMQRYNPPYEEVITGFRDNAVLGENGQILPNFKLRSSRLMAKGEHRVLLFKYLRDWASRQNWELPINMFFDMQDCEPLVIDKHPFTRARELPFSRRAHTEADQEIPRLLQKLISQTPFRRFGVYSVDSDVLMILLCKFYKEMAENKITIVMFRDDKQPVSLNEIARYLAEWKLDPGLFSAICIVACKTDFTIKSHYTPYIGAERILSLEWINAVKDFFRNKFNPNIPTDLDALLHVLLHLKARETENEEVFVMPDFRSLDVTFSQILEYRRKVKEKNNSRGKETVPQWLNIAKSPFILDTPRSVIEAPALKQKGLSPSATSNTGESKSDADASFVYVSGDADVGNRPTKKVAISTIVEASASASASSSRPVKLPHGQKSLNMFGFTGREAVAAPHKEYDPTPRQSFQEMWQMVNHGVVVYWH